MDRTLIEELTRRTITDVETEPEDWTTYFDAIQVAGRLNLSYDEVCDLIEDGELEAVDFGDEAYMVPLVAIKEFMFYDKKCLFEVPWDDVIGTRPGFLDRLFEEEFVNCCALQAEARYLKRKVDDYKRQRDSREDIETN